MVNGQKENLLQNCYHSDNLLLKPFAFGWTREVVNRSVSKNRNPSCDIYYFSPSGKKIRSLIEVKSHLTDGLTSECFSFKRQPLGFKKDFETIRNARTKQKQNNLCSEISKSLKNHQKKDYKEILEKEKINIINNNKNLKKIKSQNNCKKINGNTKNYNAKENKIEKKKDIDKKISVSFTIKNNIGEIAEKMDFISKPKKEKFNKINCIKKNIIKNSEKKKNVLQKRINEKFNAHEKIFKKIIAKKSSSDTKLLQKKKEKRTNDKKKSQINYNYQYPSEYPSIKTSNKCEEPAFYKKVIDSNEENKNSVAWDLKSIVKKNIGKYREMREKQKLKCNNLQVDQNRNKLRTKNKYRITSESIAKNKHLYLKPFEKGWKRELVFRTNCAKPGQQADVYYFHPSGKKLRSCREIAENLTRGLTIEYFTFRKEPIGCGEPLEIIRNARSHIKSLL